ncbi:hypothetical protein AAFF_G00026790 [Aldrovandia affinis]|uniref:L1 transposable element RRM domain-containing protein n=1 Tax=Aldrovandia affinis TaxID=143900 RepID=A0AAD7S4T5_9TELE|nr:hypothetical protein AAFF_G00026790 [Aldrovandia affinis]
MITFVEGLLRSQLDLNPSRELHIERAHQALAPRPIDAAKLRSIVATFLSYKVKEEILRLTWTKKGFTWQGNKININHNYAPEILRECKKYAEAKRILKDNNIIFKSLFPVRLRVNYEEGTTVYNSAEEATKDMAERKYPVIVIKPPGSLMERIQRLTWRAVSRGAEHGKQCLKPSYKERLQSFRRSPPPEEI